MFLTPSDFTGKYELHLGHDEPKLISYIEQYEPKYLQLLFGASMYQEFMSDIDPITNEPQSPNFLELWNPIAVDNNLLHIIQSDGIKTMLKGFIYFEFARDLMTTMTPYGAVKQATENGTINNTIQTLLYVRYNEAIRNFKAIREFIYYNQNPPTGQVVTVELNPINLGTNYLSGTVPLLNLTQTNIIGEVLSFTQDTAGSGYTTDLTNVPTTTAGAGTGLTVDITTDGDAVLTVTINQGGLGYLPTDTVTIDAGNLDCQLTITDSSVEIIQINPEPLGDGATATITAETIGTVNGQFLSVAGSGYSDGEFSVFGSTGTGMLVAVTVDPLDPTGQVFTLDLVEGGEGYTAGDTVYIQGGNGDAEITITSVTEGKVTEIQIANGGVGYKIGDQLLVDGGNQDCVVEVTYIGIGDRKNYNGVELLYAYWI